MKLKNNIKKRIQANCKHFTLITGASSGIGEKLSEGLAMSGVDLILCARDEKRLHEQASEYKEKYGINAMVFSVDLSLEDNVLDLLSRVEPHEIDCVIHAAGYANSGFFIENTLEDELNMLHLNVQSNLLIAYEFATRFNAQKRGNIVLISSILAYQGVAFSSNYAATKAYVHALAEGLAVELKPRQVNVLVAAPGPTLTKFSERADMTMRMAMNPEEVAISILKNIGRSGSVNPGFLSKFLAFGLHMLPRFGKKKLMTSIMKKMSNKV